jgi:hypothetical protein
VPRAPNQLRRRPSAHKMTRWAPENENLISDNEEEAADHRGQCSNCLHRGVAGTRCPVCEEAGFVHESSTQRPEEPGRLPELSARERVTARIRRLLRVGRAGNELPAVGQACLILRGDARSDLGQECVVTKQALSRVHISYRGANGRQATKIKHPGSLVLLEDGLRVMQDQRGFVWVRRELVSESG